MKWIWNEWPILKQLDILIWKFRETSISSIFDNCNLALPEAIYDTYGVFYDTSVII